MRRSLRWVAGLGISSQIQCPSVPPAGARASVIHLNSDSSAKIQAVTQQRIWPVVLCLILLSGIISGNAQSSSDEFTLEQVSNLFPSKGFEPEIAFWRKVFAEYGTKEVIFHDQSDLRLIYFVEKFEKDTQGDSAEARRQNKFLKKRQADLQGLLDDIRRHGTDSPTLTAEHKAIIKVLTDHGYEINSSLLGTLRDNTRYQRGVRDKFRDSLIRSGLYMPHIRRIFEEHGLPIELAALPHVESSFDYNAYSKAGAAGIWQFTRGTGRSYMTISRYVDERLDPIRATEAAAQFFKESYDALGTWPLAITSYNHGRNGMRRAHQQFGDDLRQIVDKYKSRYFGFASRNFYCEFLAALEVSRNAEKYFGELEIEDAINFDTITLDKSYDAGFLTSIKGLNTDVLVDLNPHLRRIFASGARIVPAGIHVRVPKDLGSSVEETLKSAAPSAAQLMVASDGATRYRIQYGDALGSIASQFGTTIRKLQALNSISDPNRIYPGQVILVSEGDGSGSVATATSGADSYTIRRGDSLGRVAARYGTPVKELLRINNLANPNKIYPGQTIRLREGASPAGDQAPKKYTVRTGDTLTQIARRFGTTEREIQSLNALDNPNKIVLGQELLIP